MTSNHVHVVAGVVSDDAGRLLLTQRQNGKHLAGLWEFPGGKCEPGESARDALGRELHEEIGIEVGDLEPLISVPWQYPEKSILLDVYRVRSYAGSPRACEAQAMRWESVEALPGIEMPAADRPVVTALRLPGTYAISAEPAHDSRRFLDALGRTLRAGVGLVQLRCKRQRPTVLRMYAQAAQALIARYGGTVLLNDQIELAGEFGLGVHLSSARLMRLRSRPVAADAWLAASCHDARELAHAASVGVDFAVLGPVKPTRSHDGVAALGWERFAQLCAAAQLPVFALGGLGPQDRDRARECGAQGIAGISAFWMAATQDR